MLPAITPTPGGVTEATHARASRDQQPEGSGPAANISLDDELRSIARLGRLAGPECRPVVTVISALWAKSNVMRPSVSPSGPRSLKFRCLPKSPSHLSRDIQSVRGTGWIGVVELGRRQKPHSVRGGRTLTLEGNPARGHVPWRVVPGDASLGRVGWVPIVVVDDPSRTALLFPWEHDVPTATTEMSDPRVLNAMLCPPRVGMALGPMCELQTV